MISLKTLSLSLLAAVSVAAAALPQVGCCTFFSGNFQEKTVSLFNGKNLDGWRAYAKDNADASATWSVTPEGTLRATGTPWGYLQTTKSFRDEYTLMVQWRWAGPALPRDDGTAGVRNSGVFLHKQEKDAIWPQTIEAQLKEGNAGDFYITDIETTELRALRTRALAGVVDEAEREKAQNIRLVRASVLSNERPVGEWNTYTIHVSNGTVSLYVNGEYQNKVTGVSVKNGYICLQSEGAPIEFRNITLWSGY
ncbi:MAG: DUF1080 domain-containing protein [Puniceicoccales bacterium]|jgi:hypothetical protein|nr:DUF1080 domain-containing protein [Puniceicoccales bacterium]